MQLCKKSYTCSPEEFDALAQFDSFSSCLNKVKSLNKKQLEKLLLFGSDFEKDLAKSQLLIIEFQEDVRNEIQHMIEETANASLEEALSKAGYKLVGHIERVKP